MFRGLALAVVSIVLVVAPGSADDSIEKGPTDGLVRDLERESQAKDPMAAFGDAGAIGLAEGKAIRTLNVDENAGVGTAEAFPQVDGELPELSQGEGLRLGLGLSGYSGSDLSLDDGSGE